MLSDLLLRDICHFVHHNATRDVDCLLQQLVMASKSFPSSSDDEKYQLRAKNFINKHATFDARGDKVWKMDAEFVYKFNLPFSFVAKKGGGKKSDGGGDGDGVEEGAAAEADGATAKRRRESRNATRRNYAEMMEGEEEEEEEEREGNKKRRKKRSKVVQHAERESSPPVDETPAPSPVEAKKRETRHRRKKEKEEAMEIEEETDAEIRDGERMDEETQRLAASLGFTSAIRRGTCRHALLEAMRDKPDGITVDEIIETSEKNGLARSWKNSRVPKNTVVSLMGDKTFSRIGRGLYVLTCYLNDEDGENTPRADDSKKRNATKPRLEKRQSGLMKKSQNRDEYDENENDEPSPTKCTSANAIEDVHEVASTRPPPTEIVDEKQLKNLVEKRTAEELQKQIAVAFEAQERAERMQDELFAKEEEYMREEREKRKFVDDAEPAFDVPEERETFQGDENDRKALLKHRKWLEEEKRRLIALREEWKKEQRVKRKKAQLALKEPIKLPKLIQNERVKVLKFANVAVEAIKVMESLRQKLDLVKKNEYDYSQDKEVVKYANKLESQQKKEHRKEEARQKKLEALAAEEALKPKLTEEEIAEIERAKAEANAQKAKVRAARQRWEKANKENPIADGALKKLDKCLADEDGREPFPDVDTGENATMDDVTIAEIEISAFMDHVGRDVTHALPPSFQSLSYELSNPTDARLGALFERILRVSITTAYDRLAELWDRTLEIGSWQEVLAQYFTYKSKSIVNTSVVSPYDEVLNIARKLSETRWKNVSRAELVSVLRLLCEDCLDSQLVRDAIERRVQAMDETKSKLWQKRREEVRKREIAAATNTAKKDADGQNVTTNNEGEENNATHDEEGEDLPRAVTERQKSLIEKRKLDEEREVQRKKEEEEYKFHREIHSLLVKSHIRAPELGKDRDGRHYYISIGGFRDVHSKAPIFLIFDPKASTEQEAWCTMKSIEDIDKLLTTLNEKGKKESALKDRIMGSYESLRLAFEKRERRDAVASEPTTTTSSPGEKENAVQIEQKSTRLSNEDSSTLFIKRELGILASTCELYDAPVPQSASNWHDWTRAATKTVGSDLSQMASFVNEIEESAFFISEQPKAGAMGRTDVVSFHASAEKSDDDDDDEEEEEEEEEQERDEDEEMRDDDANATKKDEAAMLQQQEWWETLAPPRHAAHDSLAKAKCKQIWRSDEERMTWKKVVSSTESKAVESSAVLAHAFAILRAQCNVMFETLEKEKKERVRRPSTRESQYGLQDPYVTFVDADERIRQGGTKRTGARC